MRRLLALLLCLSLSGVSEATFSYYKSATLRSDQAGTVDSTNWPLPIALDGNVQPVDVDLKTIANGGFVTSANGYDIRPYADAGLSIPLTYELVFYDATTGKMEMHVNIPTLSTSVSTIIYLAFGDSTITTDGTSNATWDSNFKGVWHLKDGTTLGLTDSTSNANNGTNHGATATAGEIDGGANFVAASAQYIDNGSGSSLAITGALTVEGWINLVSVTSSPRLLGRESIAGNLGYTVYYTGSPATFVFRVYTGAGSSDLSMLSTASTGSWAYIVGTIDGSKNGVVYLNGTQSNTGTYGSLPLDSGTSFLISARNDLDPGRFVNGAIDEVRISATTRSASYVTANYNSMKASSTFITWGSKVAAFTGSTINNPLQY